MTRDDWSLIELHKLAAEGGDSLVPELHEILRCGNERPALGADACIDLVREAAGHHIGSLIGRIAGRRGS